MFKNMKPLPKAIIIGAPIALAIWAISAFSSKPVEVASPPPQQLEVIKEPSVVQKSVTIVAESTQLEAPQKQDSVTAGTAGLNALMQHANKK